MKSAFNELLAQDFLYVFLQLKEKFVVVWKKIVPRSRAF